MVVSVHSKTCLSGLRNRLQQSHSSIIPKYKQLTWILCSSVLEVGSISCFKWKRSKLLYLRPCHLLQAELEQIIGLSQRLQIKFRIGLTVMFFVL